MGLAVRLDRDLRDGPRACRHVLGNRVRVRQLVCALPPHRANSDRVLKGSAPARRHHGSHSVPEHHVQADPAVLGRANPEWAEFRKRNLENHFMRVNRPQQRDAHVHSLKRDSPKASASCIRSELVPVWVPAERRRRRSRSHQFNVNRGWLP